MSRQNKETKISFLLTRNNNLKSKVVHIASERAPKNMTKFFHQKLSSKKKEKYLHRTFFISSQIFIPPVKELDCQPKSPTKGIFLNSFCSLYYYKIIIIVVIMSIRKLLTVKKDLKNILIFYIYNF